MSPADLFLFADRAGVFVFALSGGILAVRQNMDLFGIILMAFLPAIGGGTLRDIILDQPVFWLNDEVNLLLAIAGGIAAFLLPSFIENFKPLRWADAAGLSLFAVTGAAKTAALGHGFGVVLIMGTMTATAGGLLRDVVANREPLLLKQDIYATAALLGALAYYLGHRMEMDEQLTIIIAMAMTFILRGVAIVFGLSLPKPGARL